MVKNNVSLQVNWIKSTRANIPKEFVMPPPTPTNNITTPSIVQRTTILAPLLINNSSTNIPDRIAMSGNSALRLHGLPAIPVPTNRSLSGLENVEPARRTSSLGLLAAKDRVPTPPSSKIVTLVSKMASNRTAQPPAPNIVPISSSSEISRSTDIHQLLKDKINTKMGGVPTVVDLTDDREEDDDGEDKFFDSSDQLLLPAHNARNKRPLPTEPTTILHLTTKRQRSANSSRIQAPNNLLAMGEGNGTFDFDDDLDLELEQRHPYGKTGLTDLAVNTIPSDQLPKFVALQSDYIKLCEERIRLLQERIEVTESTALSEDMKKIRKENLTPKLLETKNRATSLKEKINEMNLPTVSTQERQVQVLSDKQAQNQELLLNIASDFDMDITGFDAQTKIDDNQLDDSDSEDVIKIVQVTQNTSQQHNILEARQVILQQRSNQPLPDHHHRNHSDVEEEEDNFGGEYTNQGLETDEEDAIQLNTQEKRELNEFIEPDEEALLDGFDVDDSYREDGEEIDGSEHSEVDEIEEVIKEVEDLKNSSDEENDNISDSLQDGVEHNSVPNIELISSDIEEDYGDGFVSQLNLEREVDLKIEDDSDVFDDDDDEMIKLTSKKDAAASAQTNNNNNSYNNNNQGDYISSSPPLIDSEDEIHEIEVIQNRSSGNEFPWSVEAQTILRRVFKLSDFRSNQLEAINSTLAGSDVFVLMPTGGGKSLCYQLPALVKSGKTRGTTIVISPLISLMQDQVDHLLEKGIKAGMINSKATADERKHMFNLFRDGLLDLVYLSPEMIGASARVKSAIDYLYKKNNLARVVVDEAHCVSSWGHDFRPDYKTLSYFKESYPDVPMMALTATANEHVRMDIIHNLGIKGAKLLKQSFNRTNLFYKVLIKDKMVLDKIKTMLSTKYKGQSGIIYCHSKMSCEQTAERLLSFGIRSAFYHAGMTPEDRLQIQKDWQSGKIQVICATIAFGMGIDKPDVRIVIHLTIPRTLEGYYQETGRAGRDGQNSECIMFFSYKDARTLQGMIQKDKELDRAGKEKHLNKLRQVLQYCDNKTDCRRQQVLQYFNEKFNKIDCREQCDNCCNKIAMVEKDVTDYAKDLINLVKSIQDCTVTLLYCQDVFKGSKSGKIIAAQHDLNPYHGKGKDLDKGTIERIFFHLISQQMLEEYSVMNTAGFASNYIKIGRYANSVLQKNKRIVIAFNEDTNKAPTPTTTTASRFNTTTTRAKNQRTPPVDKNLEQFRYDEDRPMIHFTQASSELRRQQSFNNNSGPIVLSRAGDFTSEQELFINRCHNALLDIRSRKMAEFNYTSTAQYVPDSLLREMAIVLPTNARDYKKLTGHTTSSLDSFLHFKPTLIKLSKERLAGNLSTNLEIPPSSIQTTQMNTDEVSSKYFRNDENNDAVLSQLKSMHFKSQLSSGSQTSNFRPSQGKKYQARGGGKFKRNSQRSAGGRRKNNRYGSGSGSGSGSGRRTTQTKSWAKPMQP